MGELPPQPQTHWNSPWEGDPEKMQPNEMQFESWLHVGIPSPPSSGGLCSADFAALSSRSQLVLPARHRPACAPALDICVSHLRSPGVQDSREPRAVTAPGAPAPSLGSSASALAVGVHQISFTAPLPILAEQIKEEHMSASSAADDFPFWRGERTK